MKHNKHQIVRTVIIDDEETCISDLKRALQPFEEVSIVGSADNYKDAKICLFEQKPDLVFLDVEMPGKNGFELLQDVRQYIEKPFHVVFYTAFEKYVIRALRESAFDFLLKPVDQEELAQIIKHYHHTGREKSLISKQTSLSALSSEMITLPTSVGLKFLRVHEIVFLKHKKDSRWGRSYWYVYLYNEEEIRLKAGLTSAVLCDTFEDNDFIQINQSSIVNTIYVNSIEIKSRLCRLSAPFDKYRFSVSRNCMGKIRERFEYL